MYQMKYFKVCRLRCRCCGSVMEYHNRSKNDSGTGYPLMCSCGKVSLDPSACAYRILGNEEDWEDLSEPWEDEEAEDSELLKMATERMENAEPSTFIPAEQVYEDLGIAPDDMAATMTKQQRHDLYKYAIGPGWWPIMDKLIPQILSIDPLAKFEIKEKWAELSISLDSDAEPGSWDRDTVMDMAVLVTDAEKVSGSVCECCGQSGTVHVINGWSLTLCDRCADLTDNQREAVCAETERKWLEEAK